MSAEARPASRCATTRRVAALFGGAFVEVAVTAQPADGAIVDALGDGFDVGLVGRRGFVKTDAFALLLDDAVDGHVVPVP